MFDGRRDDLAARRLRVEQTADRERVRLSAATRENDLAGLAVEHRRDGAAGGLDGIVSAATKNMRSVRVAVQLVVVRSHRRDDFINDAGGGVVVEVNRRHAGADYRYRETARRTIATRDCPPAVSLSYKRCRFR